MSALENVTEAKVVRVQPGDVVFLKVARKVTASMVEAIKEQAQPLWPDNKVVVGMGVDIEVIRAESA